MIKRFAISAGLLGAALANAPLASAGGEAKVLVCHVPPGNPANAHTISIGATGVSAHLAHGDYLGECGSGSNDGGGGDITDMT